MRMSRTLIQRTREILPGLHSLCECNTDIQTSELGEVRKGRVDGKEGLDNTDWQCDTDRAPTSVKTGYCLQVCLHVLVAWRTWNYKMSYKVGHVFPWVLVTPSPPMLNESKCPFKICTGISVASLVAGSRTLDN